MNNYILYLFFWNLLSIIGSFGNKDIRSTIGFQVHSWNNLDQWEQGFWKGMQWMKIDPHFMPLDFCLNQSQLENKTDERGCFVLNHDTPINKFQYNTTDNVLEYIVNPKYIKYFQRPNWRVFIALCFKYDYGNNCNGDIHSQHWMSLVDQFYNRSMELIRKFDLNLEFVLDGSDAEPCTSQRWRPWVRTWGGYPTDPIFTSNEVDKGWDRDVVLDGIIYDVDNVPIIDPGFWVSVYGNYKFGKFLNVSYPWLWYEPSDQLGINMVCSVYLYYDIIHDPGFLFAINIDPILFTVFTGQITEKAWNYGFQLGISYHPLVTVIPLKSKYLLVTLYWKDDIIETVNMYQISSFETILGKLDTKDSDQLLEGLPSKVSCISSTFSPFYKEEIPIILVGDNKGNYVFYQLTSNLLSLEKQSSGFLQSNGTMFSSFNLISSQDQLFILQVFENRIGLFLQLWNVSESFEVEQLGDLISIDMENKLSSASLAGLAYLDQDKSVTIKGILSYSDIRNEIFFVYFEINISEKKVSANLISSSTYLDVGSLPKVSTAIINQTQMIIEVHGNGYCYNSDSHNKHSGPPMCQLAPTGENSTNYILNYNYASIDSWKESIQIGKQLSPCHPLISHGYYDQGQYPSVALFSDNKEGITAGVVAVHDGRPPLAENDANIDLSNNDCGVAEPYEGIVIDSWPMPIIIKYQY